MDAAQLTGDIYLMLFFAGALAGFIDALAGGGGLIALPALVLTGIPPLMALGTNKLQGCVGTATATAVMFRKQAVTWKEIQWLALSAFIGALIGTVAVQFIDSSILDKLIPIILFLIALYFLFAPNVGEQPRKPKSSIIVYRNCVIPAIGCYDGIFGPGTGSFFSLAGVALRGQSLIQATARAKVLNFSTNIAALTVYLVFGQVMFEAGLAMIFGQLLGAWVGAHSLFKINTRVLRTLIVSVCMAMLVRYAYLHNWFSLA